jgi:uncharacterized Zn finger protein
MRLPCRECEKKTLHTLTEEKKGRKITVYKDGDRKRPQTMNVKGWLMKCQNCGAIYAENPESRKSRLFN